MSAQIALRRAARLIALLVAVLASTLAFAAAAQAAIDPYAGRLSAGTVHSCAIAAQDDRVVCWGLAARGNLDVPADLGPAKAVIAGYDFSCALRPNGRAVCWGGGFGPRWDAPADSPDFVALTGGFFAACGLTQGGMRACWEPPGSFGNGLPVSPWRGDDELGPFTQLSHHSSSLCGVRADQTAWCHPASPLASRPGTPNGVPPVPAGLGTVDSVSAGLYVACAVRTDQTLQCWGRNLAGLPPVPSRVDLVKQVQVGTYHACVIGSDDTPFCWAKPAEASRTPVNVPADIGRVRLLSGSGNYICAIQAAGTVRCWGNIEQEVLTPPPGLGRVAPPMDLPPSCTDVNVEAPFNTAAPVTFTCTGRDLSYRVSVPADHGSVSTPDAGGTQYSPNGGFQGADSFEITATDAANRTATFTVRVTVAGPRDLTPDPNDQLTGQDADTFWDLDAGETDTFTLRCDPGKIAVDGHPLIQAVDQGTGQPADVEVLESRRIDRRTYQFRLSNPASGRAQGHLAVACISEVTFKGHELEFRDGPTEQVWIGGFESESEGGFEPEWSPWGSVTLSCGDGWTAVAPGFRVNSGSATLTQSQPSLDGSAWTFTFFTWGSARIDTWISCLSYADAGRTMLLRSYRATTSGSVAGGDLVKRDTPLDCEVGFVGLVGGFATTPELRVLGQETQAKRRLFWLQNTSGSDQSATFSLLCLGLVTATTSSPILAPGCRRRASRRPARRHRRRSRAARCA